MQMNVIITVTSEVTSIWWSDVAMNRGYEIY